MLTWTMADFRCSKIKTRILSRLDLHLALIMENYLMSLFPFFAIYLIKIFYADIILDVKELYFYN